MKIQLLDASSQDMVNLTDIKSEQAKTNKNVKAMTAVDESTHCTQNQYIGKTPN
jgi:hypothetical protein